MPRLDAWGLTDTGPVRQNNEDNWLYDAPLALAVVADGMGGAACGEIASAVTIEAVSCFTRHPPEPLPRDQLLKEAIREANRRVLARAQLETDCNGMGSTIVAVWFQLPQVVIANVGDSRAYLRRGGALQQLSYDQTLANELRRTLGLSEEQIAEYPHRNVLTMAVGSGAEVLIQVKEERLEPGDEILLCSDGLSGVVSDAALGEILARGRPVRQTAEELIEAAKQAGTQDNVTVVVVRYTE